MEATHIINPSPTESEAVNTAVLENMAEAAKKDVLVCKQADRVEDVAEQDNFLFMSVAGHNFVVDGTAQNYCGISLRIIARGLSIDKDRGAWANIDIGCLLYTSDAADDFAVV